MTQTVKVIKNLMKEHGMSQKFMAEQIGVTEAGISRWMQGKRNPDIQYVEKMAEVLGYKLSIEDEDAEWIDDKCSVCGKRIKDLIDSPEWYRNEEPNFCPFCGKKFKE